MQKFLSAQAVLVSKVKEKNKEHVPEQDADRTQTQPPQTIRLVRLTPDVVSGTLRYFTFLGAGFA